MRRYFFLLFLLTILGDFWIETGRISLPQHSRTVKIAFYNVENLFDTRDDTCVNDDEFLPWGLRAWNEPRLEAKLARIAKVLIGLGQWDMPVLAGLCEVENSLVLNRLIHETPLASWPLETVHFESPDHRGIDVALIYNKQYFEVLKSDRYPVSFANMDTRGTRDILHVKGCLNGTDTLHIFINHWPSRYGDYAYTGLKREFAARILLNKVDSLLHADKSPSVIIMGDFNDEPWDQSLRILENQNLGLVNLMLELKRDGMEGTMKYQSQWYFFDQIMVSTNLLPRCEAFIYKPDFLLMDDEKYFGKKPFRTYYGMKYLGGFSDHLPVYLELTVDR